MVCPETKRGPLEASGGPKSQECCCRFPIEAISTIQVFYLFVTILWETRGTICSLELLFDICLVFVFCLMFVCLAGGIIGSTPVRYRPPMTGAYGRHGIKVRDARQSCVVVKLRGWVCSKKPAPQP
jgi:hypothetical protein